MCMARAWRVHAQVESVDGSWGREGLYELVYAPASRGRFLVHVLCVGPGSGEPPREVGSFTPIPIEVTPLGPDAPSS